MLAIKTTMEYGQTMQRTNEHFKKNHRKPPYSTKLIRDNAELAKQCIDVRGVSPGAFEKYQQLGEELASEIPDCVRTRDVKRAASIAQYLTSLLETVVYAASTIEKEGRV